MTYKPSSVVEFDWRVSGEQRTRRLPGEELASTAPIDGLELLSILEYALEGRTYDELVQFVRAEVVESADLARQVVDDLVDAGFVVRDDATDAFELWREHRWGPALSYHLTRMDSGEETSVSPPDDGRHGTTASVSSTYRSLQPPSDLPDRPLDEVTLDRYTCRNFEDRSFDEETASTLLDHTFAPVRDLRDRIADAGSESLSLREFRHAGFEVYPVLTRVEEFDPGIYHYSIREHALAPIELFDDPAAADEFVTETAHTQRHPEGGAMTVLFSNKFDWNRSWCDSPRGLTDGYLAISQHLHRFILVATALGLENFLTPALKDDFVDDAVGLDGYSEAVSYVATVGR